MSGSAARRAIAIVCALLCAAEVLAGQKPKPGQAPRAGTSKTQSSSQETKPAASVDQQTPQTIIVRLAAGRGDDAAPVSGAAITAVTPRGTMLTFKENPENKGSYEADASGNGSYVFTVEADNYITVVGKKQLPDGGKWLVPFSLEV